jgi:hypothetical protein
MATVIEVIPDNNPMIWLDNMGIIDRLDSIKCVKIVANGTIIDNPNPKWRNLEEFLLIPGKLNTGKKYQKSVLGQHVGNLLKQLKRQSMEFAEEIGMPQDLLCLPCSDGSR